MEGNVWPVLDSDEEKVEIVGAEDIKSTASRALSARKRKSPSIGGWLSKASVPTNSNGGGAWSKYENRDTNWRNRYPRQPQQNGPASKPLEIPSSDSQTSGTEISFQYGSLSSLQATPPIKPEPSALPKCEDEMKGTEKIKADNVEADDDVDKELLRLEGKGMDDTLAKLSDEQKFVLSLILKGESIFFTGAAGTGKSFLLKAVRQAFEALGKGRNMFVTGTTGIAACNIGGTTLHSFSGIGLGKGKLQDIIEAAYHSKALRRWQTAEVLIIDEISMLDARTFDIIDAVGRYCRQNTRPFGGVQLVLCGDFFQLPPVGISQNRGVAFCFAARAWARAVGRAVVLTRVFRQENGAFVALLNALRLGLVPADVNALLRRKVQEAAAAPPRGEDAVRPTRLFALNRDVDAVNRREMDRLTTKARAYTAQDRAASPTFERLLANLRAPAELVLKQHAQVILLKNLNPAAGLVNGSTGIVRGFQQLEDWPGWGKLPKVEFFGMNGESLGEHVIEPHTWEIQQAKKTVAERIQVPLQLAWALSVHKSQGMTIPNLEIDLGPNIFDYGQAYVAISRATDLDTLRVVAWEPRSVRAHPLITQFYATLRTADTVRRELRGGCTSDPGSGSSGSTTMGLQPPGLSAGAAIGAMHGDGWKTAKTKTFDVSKAWSQYTQPQANKSNPENSITAEQRARMEANRKAALARRAEKMRVMKLDS